MEETQSVAAEESPSTITRPSPSSSFASPAKHPDDPLAKALQTLFLNVTFLVQGELQVRGVAHFCPPSFGSFSIVPASCRKCGEDSLLGCVCEIGVYRLSVCSAGCH